MTETTVTFLLNYGILGIIAIGVFSAAIWVFRQIAPRMIAVLDAQIAMTNSIQTSTLNTTGALQSIDRSLQALTERIEEREEEDSAYRQSSMERLNTMEHTMGMLVIAHQQREGVNCGSADCPAMQLLSRPAHTRTRATDYGSERQQSSSPKRQHEDEDRVMGDSG